MEREREREREGGRGREGGKARTFYIRAVMKI
jgi:hypothetical protein